MVHNILKQMVVKINNPKEKKEKEESESEISIPECTLQ
jgi:hypothetical protein